MPNLSPSAHTVANSDLRDLSKGHQPIEWDELVHNLRQPLSAIESLAYYLELVCADPKTRTHLQHIQEMVTQANSILEHASLEPAC